MSEMSSTSVPASDLIGVEIVERKKARGVGRMMVRDDPCTSDSILHDGAYMAFSDALRAVAAC